MLLVTLLLSFLVIMNIIIIIQWIASFKLSEIGVGEKDHRPVGSYILDILNTMFDTPIDRI